MAEEKKLQAKGKKTAKKGQGQTQDKTSLKELLEESRKPRE
ncbi:MAG: hypothetical protein UU77_C0003G0038 [candidate division WWE3 bacterium GW2011_GWC1_41_7]|nr:MAG: hypothetical protein UU72_C0018G0014 [candidate division WWE3 bacterium GW2011_GWB1_41_6]KKS21258.1 MAG: hypothetical protein UU80_C0032G0022 [candidate division WWE3 bacterium GW2011_GWA1_41_8]KKS21410.1 MAG: hypothetical protein UU77_C0003G0038 [candidate division WWE3 bacterium GW2011_GWC1_41_7]